MPDIEIREGETMAQALMRLAKEKAGDKPASQVDSPSPVAQKTKKERAKKGQVKRDSAHPDRPRPVGDFGGDPNDGQPTEPSIYMALHVYQRDGETVQKTRVNAAREREMHGPGTLVFCHLHSFGSKCDSNCTARVVS